MLPSAGCEEVGLTSFGYNDVFKMEVANGFFYEKKYFKESGIPGDSRKEKVAKQKYRRLVGIIMKIM